MKATATATEQTTATAQTTAKTSALDEVCWKDYL
jgi:hypothetical protein